MNPDSKHPVPVNPPAGPPATAPVPTPLDASPAKSVSNSPIPAPDGGLLQVTGVSWKPRDGKNAPFLVEDVNLELRRGEMTGLIGPNGAGKSSLIRLLTGYHAPQSGQVFLQGKNLQDWSHGDRARAISYCAQEIPQDFPFTLRDLVEMGRFAHPAQSGQIPSGPANLVDSLIEYVGLAHKASQPFASLSGGEKQLALFARALAQDGVVFILDEPSSGLDMGTEHRLFSMLRELCMEGRGVIAAVHHLNTAAEYCDRLLLMHRGKIRASGTPAEILQPGLIEEVYGVRVKVSMSEYTGAPLVQHGMVRHTAGACHVHIIGGGGSAMNLTRLLVSLGIKVTGGVSHGFDSDCRLWKNLGLEQVEVPPFSPIDPTAFEAARQLVGKADLVVLTDFPVGPGNFRNLELVPFARQVVCLGPAARERDLWGAEAGIAWSRVKDQIRYLDLQELHGILLKLTEV